MVLGHAASPADDTPLGQILLQQQQTPLSEGVRQGLTFCLEGPKTLPQLHVVFVPMTKERSSRNLVTVYSIRSRFPKLYVPTLFAWAMTANFARLV